MNEAGRIDPAWLSGSSLTENLKLIRIRLDHLTRKRTLARTPITAAAHCTRIDRSTIEHVALTHAESPARPRKPSRCRAGACQRRGRDLVARVAAADPRWRDTLVAGVVQHFEFTFELCWKMLKRQLEREVPSPSELDGASYRQLFRLGHERGLVTAVESWFEFRELRNITAHTYARDKALKVAAGAPLLLVQARALLSAIEARNHD